MILELSKWIRLEYRDNPASIILLAVVLGIGLVIIFFIVRDYFSHESRIRRRHQKHFEERIREVRKK